MITFLGCDGQWSAMTNPPSCSGELLVFTAQEIVATQQLSSEDYQALRGYTAEILIAAFVFVALKKTLWRT